MKYPNGSFRAKECRACSRSFVPEAPSQKYCGPQCRGKTAYYERNYGITEAQYEEFKAAQGHCCYLCGSPGFTIGKKNHTEKLAVDHCHATGVVRKLLCHNCNRALGLMKDNPELLRKAADYVEAYK